MPVLSCMFSWKRGLTSRLPNLKERLMIETDMGQFAVLDLDTETSLVPR